MEVEILDYVLRCIKEVGFPIFISLYLIIRFEKTLKNNTKAINSVLDYVKKK